ncbi:MAG: hydantoinase B/oxoprolinase family protein [Deltaproteobacteria bacterium]|nr:hydantoinase B/oxoprolinase family protein [Deltaproteobacteria bacterium]
MSDRPTPGERLDDPVELTVWRHLLSALTEEMGVVLGRAAFSPNIKERRDFSCALFEPGGEMVAHAAHIPVHLGATPLSVAAARAALDLGPGDVAILNDPFAGGTHLPDLTSVEAVFDERGERLLGLVAVRAHHADVGGERPGSMPLTDHIDAEGVRLPPTLVQRAGAPVGAAIEAFANASRDPAERRGDLEAQLAASRAGAARLRSLADRFGEARLDAALQGLVAHAGRAMRATLRALPDGRFEARDWLDDDGRGHGPLELHLALTLEGERATLDFRGSADACEGPLNAVRAIVVSATLYALRLLTDDDVPDSSGLLEPVEILTRPGSILDARHPSPVAGGNVETSQRVVDLILAALAGALPGEIPAQSQGTMNNVLMGGSRPHPWAYYETLGGGAGAGPGRAGASAVHSHMTNTLNTPIEVIEHTTPLRVLAYRLRRGSGGAGARPGGEGLVRGYLALEPTEVTLVGERRERAPAGAAGGGAGLPGAERIVRAGGRKEALPAKCEVRLEPGDALWIETPGGGGHGVPEP